MALGDKIKCYKWLVGSFVIIYTIVAAAIAIFTLYLRFEFFSASFMQVDTSIQDKYYIAISILIASSVLATIAGIICIFGACLRNTILLSICLTMIVLFLLLQIAGGCYAYYYRYTIKEDIQNGRYLSELVKSDYGYHKVKTEAMDYLQWQLACCGGEGFTDYRRSAWYTNQKEEEPEYVVPPSCCVDYERNRHLRKLYPCRMYRSESFGIRPDINHINERVNNVGCGTRIFEYIVQYYIPLVAVTTGFIAHQIIVIILISMLIYYLRQRYREEEGFEMSRSFEKGGPPYF